MNFYAVWPPLLGFVGLFFFANTPLFKAADAPPSPRKSRVAPIDGLRGFLALSVVFFHGAIYHRYVLDGHWEAPPGSYYTLLGTGGVAVFFMITGYLFWSRMIDEDGRQDWPRFYIGRVFRIGPLYLLTIFLMLFMVMMQAGWRLNVSLPEFLRGLAPWLALGLLDPTDVNGHPATLLLTAGVTWSLRYEWLFYLALPFIAFAADRRRVAFLCVLTALVAGFLWILRGRPFVLSAGDPAYATLFLTGMSCAALGRTGWSFRINDRVASAVVVALLLTLFSTCQIAYTPLAIVLLGLCFYLVTSGCTLFGALTHRASKRLGDVSYGIYLLQGLVLTALFQARTVRAFALVSPVRHWTVVLGAAIILVGMATIAHAWIERPGIALGKRMAALWPTCRRMTQVPE